VGSDGQGGGAALLPADGRPTHPRVPVHASRLYSTPLDEVAKYKAEGYGAIKLQFDWGPIDGAAEVARNVEPVRTVRETAGDQLDVMDRQSSRIIGIAVTGYRPTTPATGKRICQSASGPT